MGIWSRDLVLQALGAGCLGLGLASSWELDTRTQSHLVTMHSWTGAAAAGLVILQVICMIVQFYRLIVYSTSRHSAVSNLPPNVYLTFD